LLNEILQLEGGSSSDSSESGNKNEKEKLIKKCEEILEVIPKPIDISIV